MCQYLNPRSWPCSRLMKKNELHHYGNQKSRFVWKIHSEISRTCRPGNENLREIELHGGPRTLEKIRRGTDPPPMDRHI